MPLGPGTRLGPYEIQSAIGAGGMGEVYAATDTNLGRQVAIKVLPDAFAHDAERLARFEREAKTLASLNHPNIAQIYGLEKSNGVQALVMELVEGEDLSQRIARGAIPIDEALPIAKQIAEALEAAHEQGIIHRDLKPANIKVTPDGVVKVLDFGLAKLGDPVAGASRPDMSLSPTITSPALMTGVGVLLGTAAYMSPEQAKGRPADKRSDIWAFGCVLYEMLTGKRPFDGEDVTDVMVAVLSKDPHWSALPASVPSPVVTLLRRCLERDRRKRVAGMAAALFAIDEHASLGGSAAAQQTTAPRRRMVAVASVALVIGVTGATLATWTLTRPAPPTLQPMRFAIVPPSAQRLVATGLSRDIAISPDGEELAYFASGTTGQVQLMVRAINQLDAVPLRDAVGNSPFFSPDGRWVGFNTGTELKKVSKNGGTPITIVRTVGTPRGASWGPDDTIVFATADRNTGLMSVPARGGEPRVLTKPDPAQGELDHYFPSVLPGGRAVLFTINTASGSIDSAQVAVLDLTTGQRKTLLRGASGAQYIDTGHLVYVAGSGLRAVRFDLARLEVVGDPVPVVDQAPASGQGAPEFDVSHGGTLVYVPGGAGTGQYGTPRSLVWVDRQGRETPINLPPRTYTYPRFSPDGTRVALDIRDQENDIWIGDLARQALTRLTFDPGTDFYPVWTPDSRRIVFYSPRSSGGDMFWQRADGTGAVERLTTALTTPHYPYSMSPDGKSLVFQETSLKSGVDLSLLTFDPKPHSQPLIATMFTETNAEISPDGHWLAYQSNESGQEEVYVRPFPKVDDGRWQISTGGGTRPLWARSGRELFYLDAGGLLTTAAVHTTPTFSAAAPMRILNTPYFGGFGGGGQTVAGRTYDVLPDGQRFLMIKDVAVVAAQNATPASIVVVLNWTEELKRLVPTK